MNLNKLVLYALLNGPWGVAVVAAAAAGIGWRMYRRQKGVNASTPGANPQGPLASPAAYRRKPAGPPRPIELPPTSRPQPEPERARSWDALDPHDPDARERLKQWLDETIKVRDFPRAEQILERIAQDDSQQEWCALHRRLIDNLRQRAT